MKTPKYFLLALLISIAFVLSSFAEDKPKLTLDEFFNSVSYPEVTLSPDGNSVVIETERADWDQQIFRNDLWLYRDDGKGGSLIQLTQSGHEVDPKWSPDGRWIAFRSERKSSAERYAEAVGESDKEEEEVSQLYVISPTGGEAIQLTQGQEDVHTFSWSADSRTLYFATRDPWTKAQKDEYKKQWKDVVQYRTAERGDTIFSLDLGDALARQIAAPTKENDADKESDRTPGAHEIAHLPLRVDDLVTSPDGHQLALLTNAINQRQEKVDDVEIYVCALGVQSSVGGDQKFCSPLPPPNPQPGH